MKLIGCDGTTFNQGANLMSIKTLKIRGKKPLQRIISLLHANELSLRHLFHILI